MVEELGFHVTELYVQITVRDGNTKSAHMNKVHDNLYFLPLDILPDEQVKAYFSRKKEALLAALDKELMPELCDYDERWGSRRCKGFCPVAKFCPEGAKINRVQLEE